jgi:hypothetical protein
MRQSLADRPSACSLDRDPVFAAESPMERILKQHRFRRRNAETVPPYFARTRHQPDPEPQPDVNRPSKQDGVIAMLRRPEGATVDEVATATGWQRHIVRGVFSGTLKKKLRLTIASAKEERGRVYRIAELPSA